MKCTIDQENDKLNPDRIKTCSDIKDCYNTDTDKYDSSKCMAWESCA